MWSVLCRPIDEWAEAASRRGLSKRCEHRVDDGKTDVAMLHQPELRKFDELVTIQWTDCLKTWVLRVIDPLFYCPCLPKTELVNGSVREVDAGVV